MRIEDNYEDKGFDDDDSDDFSVRFHLDALNDPLMRRLRSSSDSMALTCLLDEIVILGRPGPDLQAYYGCISRFHHAIRELPLNETKTMTETNDFGRRLRASSDKMTLTCLLDEIVILGRPGPDLQAYYGRISRFHHAISELPLKETKTMTETYEDIPPVQLGPGGEYSRGYTPQPPTMRLEMLVLWMAIMVSLGIVGLFWFFIWFMQQPTP